MNAVEFAYWLRGYFELGDKSDVLESDSLNGDQVNTIRSHIGLVKRCDWENPVDDTHHFISWLSGFLDRRSEGVAAAELPELVEHLDEIFRHQTADDGADDGVNDTEPERSQDDVLQKALEALKEFPPVMSVRPPSHKHRCSRGRLVC